MKKIYAALAVAGFVLPMWQFASFVRDHGLDLRAFVAQIFANHAASTFAFDLLVSCGVFWVVVYTSSVRHRWAYVAMTLLVGLSFALPMFLFARARTEHSGGTLPLTGDDSPIAAATARTARPVG
ncbi:MAG TPA: DUF2834 domain-containing protein [Thermoanaerobaculia bacterium]|nr:DUF2834 domain-containing protein [Thermoanaerobaculia bacterium]